MAQSKANDKSGQEPGYKHVRKIGLISDTHGVKRPEALEALRDSELIVHAGDVGKPEILAALRNLAPVVAVRGNVDKDDLAKSLPDTAVGRAGDVLLYVLHDVHTLDLNPAAAGFHVVGSAIPLPATIRSRLSL